jgi:hypothetical protein
MKASQAAPAGWQAPMSGNKWHANIGQNANGKLDARAIYSCGTPRTIYWKSGIT